MLKIINNNIKLNGLTLGNKVQFSVELKNESLEEINIWQVKPGCGDCTSVILEKAILGVGETTFLNVTFTPKSTGSYPKIIKMIYKIGKERGNKESIFTFNVSVAS
jgi:hypothetical protein